MSPEQLDAHFKSYVHAKNSFFSQMSLVQGDFDKLPSITKKKVLINMTGVRQLMATNPNPQVLEGKAQNLKQLVGFCKENSLFLNAESKQILSGKLQGLLKEETNYNLKNMLNGNPVFQLDLINTAQGLLSRESL